MIKLTKSNINTLIARYFEDEGYVYTKFTFTAEAHLEMEHLRRNLDLVSLVAMGLQYLYGVEHFKENVVKPCDVLYTLIEEHKCETVDGDTQFEIKLAPEGDKKARPRKPRKKKGVLSVSEISSKDETVPEEVVSEEDPKKDKEVVAPKKTRKTQQARKSKRVKQKEEKVESLDDNPLVEELMKTNEEDLEPPVKDVETSVNDFEQPVKEDTPISNKEDLIIEAPLEQIEEMAPNKTNTTVDDVLDLVGSLKSNFTLMFSERSLTECKEAERITWNGDYLVVKTVTNELFGFRFGVFIWRLPTVDISAIQWNDLGLVTGEPNGRVTILNIVNYRMRVYEKHNDVITRLLYKDKRIFSCSKDGYMHSTDDLFSAKVFSEGIKDALFLEDWRVFCTSFDGNIALIDVKNNTEAFLKGHSATINNIEYWDNIVSTGSEDGDISIYNILSDTQFFFNAHPTGVSFHCWVNGYIVSAGKDNIVKLWDIKEPTPNPSPVSTYRYPGIIRKMKSCNGILALIADDQTISIFDDHMGLVSRYSLVGTPKDFEFSEDGDSICVLIDNNYPIIINLVKEDANEE